MRKRPNTTEKDNAALDGGNSSGLLRENETRPTLAILAHAELRELLVELLALFVLELLAFLFLLELLLGLADPTGLSSFLSGRIGTSSEGR